MNKLYRKKNTTFGVEEAEMNEISDINDIVEDLEEFGEKNQYIEVLVDRIADPNHYRFFGDIDFIIEAIGAMNYPGNPAIDVLPSQDDIDQERRDIIKDYIFGLSSWLKGIELEDALGEFKANEKILRNVYIHLGDLDEDKKHLIQYLIDALSDKVSSPDDVISQITEEEFIFYVYKIILDREPDKDELKLKMMGLKRGQSRQKLIKEVMDSKENSKRMLNEIATSIELTRSSN